METKLRNAEEIVVSLPEYERLRINEKKTGK